MKLLKLSSLMVLSIVVQVARPVVSQAAQQQNNQVDSQQDIDSLGGNDALMKMASSLDPENRSRIIQNRIVDRHNRFELGLTYGAAEGGDPYVFTQSFGVSADFHINPRFSLGVRYYDYSNNLTPEGSRVFQDAQNAYNSGGKSYITPDVDYPISTTMAVMNWYPIYGKTNLLDWGIAQFDMYLIGGAGQITLDSGTAPIYTAGGGLAFWINKHVTTRAEIRYQTYQDTIITGPRTIENVVGTVGLGYLL